MHKIDFVFLSFKPNQDDIAVIRTNFQGTPRTAFSGDCKPATIEMLKQQVLRFSDDYVVVTHGLNSGRIFEDKAWVDIAQLAWPLLFAELLSSRRLEALCQYFDMPYNATCAETECACIAQVFLCMLKRYRTALVGEKAMTDLGGETLRNLRNFMGF